jgi:hypothetical protein
MVTEVAILTLPPIYYGVCSLYAEIFLDELELHGCSGNVPIAQRNLQFGIGAGFLIAVVFGVRRTLL